MNSMFCILLDFSPDTSRIFVDVGLGFHAEFTLDEALCFIDSVETRLNGYGNSFSYGGSVSTEFLLHAI